ncbi:MAG: hypothetical protein SPL89_09220 [Clostridia bacterium]|nr:hypothetical protein [Clostridia bacterium]
MPRITPAATNDVSILAGVSFVQSISSCPKTHISPPKINAFKYIIIGHLNGIFSDISKKITFFEKKP